MSYAPERRSCHNFVSNIGNKRLKKIKKNIFTNLILNGIIQLYYISVIILL